jgi:hypothetical protein
MKKVELVVAAASRAAALVAVAAWGGVLLSVAIPGCSHADLASIAKRAAPVILEQAMKLGEQIDKDKSVCFPVPEAELPEDFGGGVVVICYAPSLDAEELEEQLE